MAKATVTLTKAKTGGVKATQKAKVGDVIPNFELLLDQNGNILFQGKTQGGATVDISAVATLTAVPADPTLLVETVTGMTLNSKAQGKVTVPGTPTNVVCTITWNDGSVGPFSITVPFDIANDPVVGIVATPSIPVMN
jgi:hypothetical protein